MIFGGDIPNIITYADDIDLMASTGSKLHQLLDNVVKASEKKALTTNFKTSECMGVSKMHWNRDSCFPNAEKTIKIQINDIRNKKEC